VVIVVRVVGMFRVARVVRVVRVDGVVRVVRLRVTLSEILKWQRFLKVIYRFLKVIYWFMKVIYWFMKVIYWFLKVILQGVGIELPGQLKRTKLIVSGAQQMDQARDKQGIELFWASKNTI